MDLPSEYPAQTDTSTNNSFVGTGLPSFPMWVRLSGVYTPPEKRKHGYAAACVHALSKQLRVGGYRCILYTDLGNAASNSIYRRIGYRAVAEALRYRFD